MKPGVYDGMSMAEYLAAPAVSASILLDVLQRCPSAGWHNSWKNPAFVPDVSTKAQNSGTIAHAILLEGSRDCVVVIDPKNHPAEKTGAIPEGWTNKSIRAARDAALAAGKIPILPENMAEIEAMVASAQRFISTLEHTKPDVWRAFQDGGGTSEVTIIWDDDGTPCRIRPDRLATDRALMVDVKSTLTTAEPHRWGRSQMVNGGYYIAAAFYRRGIRRAFGVESEYLWLVIEQEYPYLCSLVGTESAVIAVGDAKCERGLREWKACEKANDWPAYPNDVVYPELPAWEVAAEEAQDGRPGIAYDIGKLWQKPELIGLDRENEPFEVRS